MENVQLNWKAKAACNENFVVMQTTEKKKNFLKIIKISEVQKEFSPTEPPPRPLQFHCCTDCHCCCGEILRIRSVDATSCQPNSILSHHSPSLLLFLLQRLLVRTHNTQIIREESSKKNAHKLLWLLEFSALVSGAKFFVCTTRFSPSLFSAFLLTTEHFPLATFVVVVGIPCTQFACLTQNP